MNAETEFKNIDVVNTKARGTPYRLNIKRLIIFGPILIHLLTPAESFLATAAAASATRGLILFPEQNRGWCRRPAREQIQLALEMDQN